MTPPGGGRHDAVGDAERFQTLRIGQQSDPLFDAACGNLGSFEQKLRGLLPLLGRLGSLLPLLVDPCAVLLDECSELGLGLFPVGQLAQGIHGQLDAADWRRGDTLDFSERNPAGANGGALAVFQLRLGGDVVADGTFAVVAVLQVGDALVPVFAFQAAEVGTGNETALGCDFELGLKGEGFVAEFVGRGRSTIDEEEGERPRSLGQAAFGAGAYDRADGESDLEAAAFRHFLLDRLFGSVGDRESKRLFAGSSLSTRLRRRGRPRAGGACNLPSEP